MLLEPPFEAAWAPRTGSFPAGRDEGAWQTLKGLGMVLESPLVAAWAATTTGRPRGCDHGAERNPKGSTPGLTQESTSAAEGAPAPHRRRSLARADFR